LAREILFAVHAVSFVFDLASPRFPASLFNSFPRAAR